MSDSHPVGGPVTALDIRHKAFDNALRGYDRGQVDRFRDAMAEEFERLTRTAQQHEDRVRELEVELHGFRRREQSLHEALTSAQQLRGDVRDQAEREAQLIIREARAASERQLNVMRAEMRKLQADVHALWRARRAELAQLRHHLERQLVEISVAEAEPVPDLLASPPSDGEEA